MKKITATAKHCLVVGLIALPAFAFAQQDTASPATGSVNIDPIGSSSVSGTMTLEQSGDSVSIKGTLNGLKPGKHGIHIHEGRSCKARGGHFTPMNAPHGGPEGDAQAHHLGDLGNVVAQDDGSAQYSGVAKGVSLTGANSIAGRVLVVHAGEDDLKSQPAGASGEQIACGVIKAAP